MIRPKTPGDCLNIIVFVIYDVSKLQGRLSLLGGHAQFIVPADPKPSR